jgi:type VI secretion system protein ImpA
VRFRETLEKILWLVNNFLKEKGEDEESSDQETDTADEEQLSGQEIADVKPGLSLSIKSRAEAYALLSAAADYLLIHEPHSPAPHLVKRAVAWGRMTLTELLQELIADDSDLKQIFKLLGLKVMEKE